MMNYTQFKNKMIAKATQNKSLISAEFELTRSCNLDCEMCYLRGMNPSKELTTDEWKKIIDQSHQMGVLFCLFTGGEIFSRSDFQELYAYTFDLGIRISLFTNGTKIDENVVQFLRSRRPDTIYISLYGADNHGYERLTKDQSGFDKVKRGIELLKRADLPIAIRILPIQEIKDQLDSILTFALEQNLPLSYSSYIALNPHYQNRLSPKELLAFGNRVQKKLGKALTCPHTKRSDRFYCNAGKSTFFINSGGKLTPCSMFEEVCVAYSGQLEKDIDRLREKMDLMEGCDDCRDCSLLHTCIQCPSKRFLEGNIHGCSPYLKELAMLQEKGELEDEI